MPDTSPSLKELLAKRDRIQQAIDAISSVEQDIGGYLKDANDATAYATVWAATLMVCDIFRIGLSAMDKRADLLFKQQDKVFSAARKWLNAFGYTSVTVTKDGLLKGLDPNLRRAADLTDSIQTAQDALKSYTPAAQAASDVKAIRLVVDLGVAMTNDTLLMLQANQTMVSARAQASSNIMRIRSQLKQLRSRMREIDQAVGDLIERAERLQSVA